MINLDILCKRFC